MSMYDDGVEGISMRNFV